MEKAEGTGTNYAEEEAGRSRVKLMKKQRGSDEPVTADVAVLVIIVPPSNLEECSFMLVAPTDRF